MRMHVDTDLICMLYLGPWVVKMARLRFSLLDSFTAQCSLPRSGGPLQVVAS